MSSILLLVSSHDLLYSYPTWPFLTQFWVSNVPTWSILCRSSGLLEEVLGLITLKFSVAFVGFQRGGRDILQLSCGWALWTNPQGSLVVEQRPGISDQLVHQTKNSFHFCLSMIPYVRLTHYFLCFLLICCEGRVKQHPRWYHGWMIPFLSDIGWFRFSKWFWRTESDL
jgi:hypothetical protein